MSNLQDTGLKIGGQALLLPEGATVEGATLDTSSLPIEEIYTRILTRELMAMGSFMAVDKCLDALTDLKVFSGEETDKLNALGKELSEIFVGLKARASYRMSLLERIKECQTEKMKVNESKKLKKNSTSRKTRRES